MVEKLVAQQSAAAVAAEPAEKAVFLGLTSSQLVAFGVGLGVGIVVGAAACYAYYQWHDNKQKVVASTDGNMFKKHKSLKSSNDILSRLEHVSTLDAENLHNWFKSNQVEIKEAKYMIAVPNEEVLRGVGYALDSTSTVDLDKFLVQSVYNSNTGAIYKLRFIGFDNIDSKLQAELLENDGLVILDC